MNDSEGVAMANRVGTEAAQSSRLFQVDGLRAIAALSVVFFHYTTQFDRKFSHVLPTNLEFSYGFLGVNLFFVISGFVIHMTLDRSASPLDFVISRFSRLFPAYWTAIFLTWTIVPAIGLTGYDIRWQEAAINLSMLQAFLSVRNVDGVYWSLQVELIFYVWMLFLWTVRLHDRSILVCITWVSVSLGASIAQAVWGLRVPYTINYFLLLDWIPWFALGITICVANKSPSFELKHWLLVLVAFAAIAAKLNWPTMLMGIFSFWGVLLASRNKMTVLAWGPLVYFGAISYPLYLLHEQIGWAVIRGVELWWPHSWPAILIALLCTVGLASLLHSIVETRCSQAIRRAYRKSRLAIDALNFNRKKWAVGAAVTIVCCALALGVTARIKRSEDPSALSFIQSGRLLNAQSERR